MGPRKYSKLRLALGNSDKAMMQTHKNESSVKERQHIHDEDIHDEDIHDEDIHDEDIHDEREATYT